MSYSTQPRVLSIFLPNWSTDQQFRRYARAATRLPDDPALRASPLILTSTRANVHYVARCCPRAAAAGAQPGMTLAHARAIGAEIRIAAFDPVADRTSLRKLAEWASRYSSVIGIDPDSVQHDAEPDGLLLDIRGVAHLFGSESALAERIRSDLAALGLTARLAIASTLGAAWALARFSREPVTLCPENAHLDRTLAPCPIAALRIGPELAASLHALGIERIEHLLALPRASLPSRFGPLVTRRLDQLRGHALDLIAPIRPEPPLHIFINFTGPTTRTDAVEHATRELLEQLAAELARKDRGVRTLEIEFTRYGPKGKDLATARIHLSRASRNPAHLWTLLRRYIENLHMGFGVEGVALTVHRQGRVRSQQLHTQSADQPPPLHEHSTGELIDILSDRLGADRVVAPVPTQSHDPHRAWKLTSVMKLTDSAIALPAPPPPRCDRPSILFDAPEPAEAVALMPDHPPSQLHWRRHTHAIVRGIGPERIGHEWWHTAPLAHTACDFHRLQTMDGSWLWVARDLSTSQWAVHGVWN